MIIPATDCALTSGMAGAGSPLANVLLYAAVAMTPTVACWAILHASRPARWVRRRFDRTPAPTPHCPPIQDLVRNLRRVHRTLAEYEPGTSMVRWSSTRQAYDILLSQACAALEIEHRLGETPEGIDRDIERLRIEESLRSAGLTIP
jgi:hypothetical protein